MKPVTVLAVAAVSLALAACAGSSKFQAFEGSLPPEQVTTLTVQAPVSGNVSVAAVNDKAANASEVLLKGGEEAQVTLVYTNETGTVSKTLAFKGPEGASCVASATTEERNYKAGSAELKTFVTFWIECGGQVAAGSDSPDDMEMVH